MFHLGTMPVIDLPSFLDMVQNVSGWSSSVRLEYNRLSRRIYDFTTAIYQTGLQSPILHAGTPRHRDTRRWLEAYQHIATLLARNPHESSNLVVTGGSLAGQMSISIFHLLPHNTTEEEPQIRVEELVPNDADLASLVHQDRSISLCDLSIHARDVFQALILASKSSDVDLDYNYLFMFILGRCWDQVRHRVEAGRHILHSQSSLVDVLCSWEPHAEDSIIEVGVIVMNDKLAALLAKEDVPSSSPRGQVYFLFGPATATKWMNVLCSVLSRFSASVCESGRNTENLQYLVDQMLMLAALLGSPAIRKIFSLTSVEDHIMNFVQRPHDKRHLEEYLQDPLYLASLFGDEQRADESVSGQVFRYLYSLLAWYHAILFLVGWLAKLGEQKPPIHIIHSFLPHSCVSTPMRQSSDRVEYEALAHIFLNFPLADKEKEILRRAVEELFRSTSIELSKESQTFIHVESFALGVVSECHNKASWLPLPKDWSRLLGRSCSQRCCYCCNMLFESLLQPQEARIQRQRNADGILMFSLPGLVVPWIPPPLGCGVPIDVLEDLEDEVRSLLISILEEYLRPLIVRILHPSQFEGCEVDLTSIP